MERESFSFSAPGSIMLLGEHAVLHGRRALVCALDRRLTIKISPRPDHRVTIQSGLGCYEGILPTLAPDPRFSFVLDAINAYTAELSYGFDLCIVSDFSHRLGLGSSAAVTVCTHAALRQLACKNFDRNQIFANSLQTLHRVQGCGSGADLSASIFGGIIVYRMNPIEILPLAQELPLSIVYSGKKRPTPEVVQIVENLRNMHPQLFDGIFDLMDVSVLNAQNALRQKDWKTFGHLLNINQGLMEAIGVGNARLSEIVYALREDPGIYGVKISGAGLGDCVIGLGHLQNPAAFPFQGDQIEATITALGLCIWGKSAICPQEEGKR